MLQHLGKNKVCIDSVHGTNGYDFDLTTLIVLDEFNSGFPTVYCISSRKDTETCTRFFQTITNKVL